MTRERDPAKICRMMARLAKETLEEWERRNQAEAAERAKKMMEKNRGR